MDSISVIKVIYIHIYIAFSTQSLGRWGRAFPAGRAVDGNTDPNVS